MAAIGSLVFCTDCGNLLDGSSGDKEAILICEVCGAENKGVHKHWGVLQCYSVRLMENHFTDTSSTTVTTRSRPSAFPSALRSKRSAVQTLTEEDVQTTATIRQTCPECGREEMRYYTLQLRSADEGSTVFYSCECGYKYVHFIHSYEHSRITPMVAGELNLVLE